jgi:hypothetical protein
MPYTAPGIAPGVDATLYTGSGTLQVSFQSAIASDETSSTETENILQSLNNYALLTCGNPVVPAFLPPDDPDYQEAGTLVSPFFFKDDSNPNFASQATFQDERTFFVQPSLTETIVLEWQGWAIAPSQPLQVAVDPNLVNQIPVVAQVPTAGPVPINPGDPVYSIFPMQNLTDWVTNPSVAISYGGVAIGKNGAIKAGVVQGVIAAAPGLPIISVLTGAKAAGDGLIVAGRQGVSMSQLQAIRKASLVASPAVRLKP